MSDVELTDPLLAKLAGWEATKHARGLLAAGRVQSSEWQAPELRGTVQEGQTAYRAGLVIRSASDADNLCTCRDSRQRGLICAHSIAVGLHFIHGPPKETAPVSALASVVLPRTREPELPMATTFKLRLSGGLAGLQAKLECAPGKSSQAGVIRLTRCGFIGPDRAGFFYLRGQDAVLNFFARAYPQIEKDWEVTLEERLEQSAEKLERVQPRFQITPSGEQWFDLTV
ncbi:MAG TPA: hypothetical protein VGN61_09725, partial [Verrucomicrobiae bacterium]